MCACGDHVSIPARDVLRRHSTSCGKCSQQILSTGDTVGAFIYIGAPISVSPGFTGKVLLRCPCGRNKDIRYSHAKSGLTSTCSHCNDVSLSDGMKYFGFIYHGPSLTFSPGSSLRLTLECPCGRIASHKVYQVSGGRTKTCGRCSEVVVASGFTIGRLTYIGPALSVKPASTKHVELICSCGNLKVTSVGRFLSGRTKSCGDCRKQVRDWYVKNEKEIRAISCPTSASSFPAGGILPIGPIANTGTPFEAICPSCKSSYFPVLDSIKQGVSLTCGCASFRISTGNRSICDFLTSSGVDAEMEFRLGGLSYDVCVPSKKLLIEHQGLHWHSFPHSPVRDLKKVRTSVEHGYSYISMYEDEWKSKRKPMESLLLSRVGLFRGLPLRPSDCHIERVSGLEVGPFYNAHHYIGSCSARIHYGVFYGGSFVAAASFSRPTRQSSHSWELVRMASDPSFRVRGIWSKILGIFLKEESPSSIVSFSDNRLFTGGVYERIGFSRSGHVRPDYYWTKGNKRFHKSALRKRGDEKSSGLTESVLREIQGYRKTWDLGKVRWTLSSPSG